MNIMKNDRLRVEEANTLNSIDSLSKTLSRIQYSIFRPRPAGDGRAACHRLVVEAYDGLKRPGDRGQCFLRRRAQAGPIVNAG